MDQTLKLSELPEYLGETLALQDILISIGYDQDDLYIMCVELGIGISIVVNDKQYRIMVCAKPSYLSQNTFVDEWTKVIGIWNKSSQQERHDFIMKSAARKNSVGLLATLATQDLIPNTETAFPCPHCGETFQADSIMGTVIHSFPPCKDFNQLDRAEFISASEFERKSN